MSDDTPNIQSEQSSEGAQATASHRERLERRPLLEQSEEGENSEGMEAPAPDVAALKTLVREVNQEETAFQSVAVAAVQILERALSYEREAAEAALSLGQQEKLDAMVETAEEAALVLRNALNAQGAKVMHLCAEQQPSAPDDGQPWWFALTDALEVLEEGSGRMASLTTAQPDGSPARKLSQLIAQLLRGHHDALLLEAEEWIS